MTDIVIDPQASGWRDDGTESGLIRAEIARGNLVQMPFKRGYVTISNNGTANTALSSGGYGNTDGTGTRISGLIASSASYANFSVIQFWIVGNVFGLRYDFPPGPIGCMIDGVAYNVPITTPNDPRTGAAVGGNLYSAGINYSLIADNLGDGAHLVELLLPGFTSGASRQYFIYGYVVDAKAGYVPLPNFVNFNNAAQSITATTGGTATALVVPPSSPSTTTGYYGYRKILFCNTSGSPVTVTAVYSTRTGTPIWQKPIPANDTIELDLGGLIGDISNLYFYASASGVVNATAIGVM